MSPNVTLGEMTFLKVLFISGPGSLQDRVRARACARARTQTHTSTLQHRVFPLLQASSSHPITSRRKTPLTHPQLCIQMSSAWRERPRRLVRETVALDANRNPPCSSRPFCFQVSVSFPPTGWVTPRQPQPQPLPAAQHSGTLPSKRLWLQYTEVTTRGHHKTGKSISRTSECDKLCSWH